MTEKDKQYIEKARQIIAQHDLQKYIDVLLSYWEENPTTLGHGFEHVLKAAVECYIFAKDNGYQYPEELFVGGLYHDIYRPAEGKDASEDHHEETAAAIESVFTKNNLSSEIKEKLINFLNNQESWRKGNAEIKEEFDLYLFLGERATHTTLMADAYAWASNQYAKENNLPPIYQDHIRTTYALIRYQVDVWKVFMKYRHLKGIERGIEAYIGMYRNATSKYFEDKKGEHFEEYLQAQSDKVRELEKTYLLAFDRKEGSITKSTRRM